MTSEQAFEIADMVIGAFPRVEFPGAFQEMLVVNLLPLPQDRSFRGVQRGLMGAKFPPHLSEALDWCGVDSDEARLLLQQAISEGGQLYRDVAKVCCWGYAPPGLEPPKPQAQLAPPTDDPTAPYTRPTPTQNRMRLDRHDRQREARRLAALLPAPPARPETGKEAVG